MCVFYIVYPELKDIRFISHNGQLFIGNKHALEYIEKTYNADILRNFQSFLELDSIIKRSHNYSWKSNDPTVPEGWKIRVKDGKKLTYNFVVSPEGVQYKSRRLALAAMIKEGADPSDIEIMRSSLEHEGYERDELLPRNWLYRDISENAFHILTENGVTFSSFSNVLSMMKDEGYPGVLIENLEKFEKIKSQTRKAALSDWQNEPNLPMGWKSRPGHGKLIFLSPDGIQFYNRKDCISALIKSNSYKPDNEKLKNFMKLDHWIPHDLLPRGWWVRTFKSSRDMFLTNEGDSLVSVIAAKEYMRARSKYSEKDVKNVGKVVNHVNRIMRLANANKNKSDKKNLKDINLPGWTQKFIGR